MWRQVAELDGEFDHLAGQEFWAETSRGVVVRMQAATRVNFKEGLEEGAERKSSTSMLHMLHMSRL